MKAATPTSTETASTPDSAELRAEEQKTHRFISTIYRIRENVAVVAIQPCPRERVDVRRHIAFIRRSFHPYYRREVLLGNIPKRNQVLLPMPYVDGILHTPRFHYHDSGSVNRHASTRIITHSSTHSCHWPQHFHRHHANHATENDLIPPHRRNPDSGRPPKRRIPCNPGRSTRPRAALPALANPATWTQRPLGHHYRPP